MEEKNELMNQRIKKLEELRAKGLDPFYNKFRVKNSTGDAVEYGKGKTAGELAAEEKEFVIAGRVMAVRNFGKASFAQLKDSKGGLQLFFMNKELGDDAYALFKSLDIGDIIGVTGVLFYTKTKELTLLVKGFSLLTKSLRPLPDKWHGLTDKETRYRQRYVDLIVNPKVKEVFVARAKIINAIREFFDKHDFLEV